MHPDFGDGQFRQVAKKWLQGADDRNGGRSKRAAEKQTPPPTQDAADPDDFNF